KLLKAIVSAAFSQLHDPAGDGIADAGQGAQLRTADDFVQGNDEGAQAFGRADVGSGFIGVAAFEGGAPSDLEEQIGDLLGIELCHGKMYQAPGVRAVQMPTKAISATRTRKPLRPMRSRAGSWRTSGRGGGGPGKSSRHTAAAKQKALKSTRTLPAARTTASALTWPRAALA